MLAKAARVLRDSRIARFLLVGAYNTLFGYVVFVALYYLLRDAVHYNVVLAISYVIAVTNSYLLQRRFVFRTQSRKAAEFLRFNVVNLGGMFINMGLLTLFVNHLTPNVPLAQAAATVLTVLFIYVGHTFYSFRIGARDR